MFTGSLEVEMMETYTRFESLMIDQLIEVLAVRTSNCPTHLFNSSYQPQKEM